VKKSEGRDAENIRIKNKNLQADESLFYEMIVNGINEKINFKYVNNFVEDGIHR
jgi:hypothetical protein